MQANLSRIGVETPLARELDGGGGGTVRAGRTRWRSHTFADGVHAITVSGRLDPALAGALRARVRELIARGCRRLILDTTTAGMPDRLERLLLGEVLARQPDECEVVVVAPWRSALRELLPEHVAVVQSFDAARTLLGTGRPVGPARRRPSPGAGLSRGERHALAVRQSLRWAEQAAAAGDFENALSWLTTVEVVEGSLPPGWAERRRRWSTASLQRRDSPRWELERAMRYQPARRAG